MQQRIRRVQLGPPGAAYQCLVCMNTGIGQANNRLKDGVKATLVQYLLQRPLTVNAMNTPVVWSSPCRRVQSPDLGKDARAIWAGVRHKEGAGMSEAGDTEFSRQAWH